MKIRYKGGNVVKVRNPDSGEIEEKQKKELEQLCEETLYIWPEPGSVLSLDDQVGGWMLAKHPKLLEAIPETDKNAPKAAPRVLVAVVPKDAKPAAPAKPQG